MSLRQLKQKIIIIVAILGALLIFIFQRGLYNKTDSSMVEQPIPIKEQQDTNQEVKMVSTNPQNLDGSTILPTQVIEITFNYPLENIGEFKHLIDPRANYTAKLSDDRKTVKITPNPTFNIGTGYTLFVKTDSKFDGGKRLNNEIILHFNTISYRGV